MAPPVIWSPDRRSTQLEAAWTTDTGERISLRDLADEFNEEVLRAALKGAGGSPRREHSAII